MFSWDPSVYSEFETERTRPAIDLLSRISHLRPRSIIDVGCGPGNSTELLARAFPDAEIIGIDASPEMVACAAERLPGIEFEVMDARDIPDGFNLVFSSSCIQWIPNHDTLIPRLMDSLESGGTLAVQLPMNQNEPLSVIAEEVAAEPRWHYAAERPVRYDLPTPETYYDILSGCSDHFDIWMITYYHKMGSPEQMVEWIRGTRLRPYLDLLSADECRAMESEIAARVGKAYHPATDGSMIMRYERLFFTAQKR